MRLFAVLAVAVAGLLSACGQSPAPTSGNGSAAAPAAPTGPAVHGMVLADAPATLAPGATLDVRLMDVTRADGEPILITQQSFAIAAVPAEFTLPYDPAQVNGIRTYAVDATVMEQGVVRYVSVSRVGVLTQGKTDRARIMLAQALSAPTPKDPVAELKKEFGEFEALLGGLRRVTGERISGPEGKEIAIGFDAFLDDSGVRMVRETLVSADGGRSNQRFAFKDGKLWVAVRGTLTVGLDAEGKVVFAERDGAAAELSEAELATLTQQADEARSLARGAAGGST